MHQSIFLSAFFWIVRVRVGAVDPLPNLSVPNQRLTISGFSSGSTFASQMQIAYSKNFIGCAIFAGTFYRCAPNGALDYTSVCWQGKRDVQSGVDDARRYEKEGLIDNLSNLSTQKLFLYIGNRDELVRPKVRNMTYKFYTDVGMKPENIFLKFQNASHIVPSNNSAHPSCTIPGAMVLGIGVANCHYNGAFESINYLLNNSLASPDAVSRNDGIKLEALNSFDQTEFLSKDDQKYMNPVGYYYIPSKCKTDIKSCLLHIGLHGCLLSRTVVGDLYVRRSGYLEVAELNNIVMIFPQSTIFTGNYQGCWDVFGATNKTTYATKNGVQMVAVRKMIEKITGTSFQ